MAVGKVQSKSISTIFVVIIFITKKMSLSILLVVSFSLILLFHSLNEALGRNMQWGKYDVSNIRLLVIIIKVLPSNGCKEQYYHINCFVKVKLERYI